MDLTPRVEATERALHGSNGYVGLVAQAQLNKEANERTAADLEKLTDRMCGDGGVLDRVKTLEEFQKVAADFMNGFKGTVNKLVLAVLGTVLGGVFLNLVLTTIVEKSKIP